ncbi:transmembrane reductase CYB561D2 [Ambystoma mexicanum]|uniref:transmembrane reductase CYB561D2 n=1 Tax=Ambystoma mexicanum TaxID=8296 RepID=UPI0037E853CF
MALSIETETWPYRYLRALSGVAAHISAVAFTISVGVVSRPGSSLFSWHPFLMSMAFSFFMTEALLIFSPESSLLRSFSRKIKVRLHWAAQLCALVCATLGLTIISFNKYLNDKPHFATWHGFLGLLTVIFAAFQTLGGITLLYHKLITRWSLAKRKVYHATSGLVGYLLGCTSLLLGMCSLWFTASVTGGSWYLAALCPLVTGLVVMNQVSNAYLYRKRSQS